MYVNCGVKNYMNEDHRSYIRNFCNHPFYGFIGFLVLELFKLINFFLLLFVFDGKFAQVTAKGARYSHGQPA